MPQAPAEMGAWTYLIPVLVIGVVILRNVRERRVRVERLWIGPALLLLLTGYTLSIQPPSNWSALMIDVAALVVGGFLGWWRGRASKFTVDAETHRITSRVSPLGMLLILAIFGLRYLLRAFAQDEATVLHVTPTDLADAFLVLAVGVVAVQRGEWFVRARKMIAESKAARPG